MVYKVEGMRRIYGRDPNKTAPTLYREEKERKQKGKVVIPFIYKQ